MKIASHSRLVFIGDSVTDCGRARPVGEGPGGALGNGYVAEVDAMLRMRGPKSVLRIANLGTNGDTILELEARWPSDVLAQNPDWLSVLIGINDVWRQFDGLGQPGNLVTPELFERTYDRLLSQTRPKLKGLVLMAPYYVEPLRTEPMRRRMDEYREIVKRLAPKHDAIYIDTQEAFDQVLAHCSFTDLAPDRVHPTAYGHKFLARVFLNAVGFRQAEFV